MMLARPLTCLFLVPRGEWQEAVSFPWFSYRRVLVGLCGGLGLVCAALIYLLLDASASWRGGIFIFLCSFWNLIVLNYRRCCPALCTPGWDRDAREVMLARQYREIGLWSALCVLAAGVTMVTVQLALNDQMPRIILASHLLYVLSFVPVVGVTIPLIVLVSREAGWGVRAE